MLQDPPMEKKPNRSVQASAKGVGTDSKKNQDVSSGKSWPRGSRRREPVGGTLVAKADRKPGPSRGKAMDKRPKPRGSNYGWASGRKENAGLAEEEAELESVFIRGSKKQSLNHLLNFHCTPRDDGTISRRLRGHSGSHTFGHPQKRKYNKEQFLQASCQFIVNSEGDYKQYLNDPDALVEWHLIEQIHVQVSEYGSCPICLYPPVAAKITKCGHVYCWSCILHYLSMSEDMWSKCPICFEAVHHKHLKSVVAMPHNIFKVGDQINFRLMKRAQGSLTAIPVEESHIDRNVLLNVSETNVSTVYSKLLLANRTEVMSIINRERAEINMQLTDEDNCTDRGFLEGALKLLEAREATVMTTFIAGPSLMDMNLEDLDCNAPNDLFEDIFAGLTLPCHPENNINVESLDISSPHPDTSNAIKHYYFYQASDGQHIYLHALNIQMLEHTYGSLENCPVNLSGRILEKEGGSMTVELRRRLRYLQHMPVTCQFEVAEIQLKPPIIHKDTIDVFQDQIELRRVRRQRRARDEKRREKRIAEEENRRMGRFAALSVPIESQDQFPACGLEKMPMLAKAGSGEATLGSPTSSSSQEGAGPSFAKMLSTGKTKPSWPGLTPIEEPGRRLVPVTGSANPAPSKSSYVDSEPESDDYIPAPTYRQSFSDSIALALESASLSELNSAAESGASGKKKKKNKQKLLFATSMMYSGK